MANFVASGVTPSNAITIAITIIIAIANHHQPSPTITNHHQPPPNIANHRQPPPTTTNHRQPPPTQSAVEATFREIKAALARKEEDYGFYIALPLFVGNMNDFVARNVKDPMKWLSLRKDIDIKAFSMLDDASPFNLVRPRSRSRSHLRSRPFLRVCVVSVLRVRVLCLHLCVCILL